MSESWQPINTLLPIHMWIGFQKMEALLVIFMLSKFNCCILVCSICFAALSQKVEEIHECALQLLLNDSYSNYNILLLTAYNGTFCGN